MDGWNMLEYYFPFWDGLFSGDILVLGRVENLGWLEDFVHLEISRLWHQPNPWIYSSQVYRVSFTIYCRCFEKTIETVHLIFFRLFSGSFWWILFPKPSIITTRKCASLVWVTCLFFNHLKYGKWWKLLKVKVNQSNQHLQSKKGVILGHQPKQCPTVDGNQKSGEKTTWDGAKTL